MGAVNVLPRCQDRTVTSRPTRKSAEPAALGQWMRRSLPPSFASFLRLHARVALRIRRAPLVLRVALAEGVCKHYSSLFGLGLLHSYLGLVSRSSILTHEFLANTCFAACQR